MENIVIWESYDQFLVDFRAACGERDNLRVEVNVALMHTLDNPQNYVKQWDAVAKATYNNILLGHTYHVVPMHEDRPCAVITQGAKASERKVWWHCHNYTRCSEKCEQRIDALTARIERLEELLAV